MRIKNIGNSLIIFDGGSLPVGMVADFKGDAEKIGLSLLKNYPTRLSNLDDIKEEEIVLVEVSPKVDNEAKKEATSNVERVVKHKK